MSKLYDEYRNILADSNKKQEEIFEWDNTKSHPVEPNNDISSVVNQLPNVNIAEAIKKFNGYELDQANVFRVETPEQKLARVRAEIKELETQHADLDGVGSLTSELESALKVSAHQRKNPVKNLAAGDAPPSGSDLDSNLNIEARITKLENALGPESLNASDLFKQVESVNRKLALLDPNNMANLDQKISQITSKMQILQKHTLSESQISKLNEMEKLVDTLGDQVPIIPGLTDRLISLKDAHERAALVLSQQEGNAAVIGKLQATLGQQKKAMDSFSEIIGAHSEVIKKNLQVLEARIEKFSK